jgi:hypothetical protein
MHGTREMRIRQADHAVQSAVNLGEASLASSYNALLRSDPELAAQTATRLDELQRAHQLRVGDRNLCNVLRPRFLGAERSRELGRVSQVVAGLMERAGRLLLQRPDLLRIIGASEEEQEIWAVDPGYPGFTLTSRLDSFMVGQDPRFIEYNAESPAGIAFTDVLADVFMSLPAVQRWSGNQNIIAFEARRALLDTLLWAYHEWGGRGTPRVAIIDWEHVITRRDFEIAATYFRDQGVPTLITDPRRIEYRHGEVRAEGQRVDLIYRRVLLHELLEKAAEARDLLQAYRDGAICMVNSPRSKLLHKKALFALLSDGRLDLDMTGEEQAIVEASVPWTRIMEPGATTYAGKPIDLEQFVLDNQDRLALKPIDDYGGRGVSLGWDSSPEEWKRAVESALSSSYVVQERVPVAEGEFPIWEDGQVQIVSLLVDTDPLLFRGEMGGILTRTSSEALLNVSAGTGSSTATLITGD